MAWYHNYFKGLPQRAWKLHQDEEYTDYEVDFLRDVLEIKESSKVLDMLAGYGRHAVPLAEEGVAMTCIDISSEYCDELKAVAKKHNLPLTVICDDVLECSFEENAFDAAFCVGNSFSFFPRAETQQFILKMANAVKSGGHIAIHTENLAESILPNFQVRNWMPVKEDIIYLAENEYRPEEGYIEAEQTFISSSEKVTHTVRQHIFTLSEITYMFESAGLQVVGTFGNLEADPFALGDEQLYLVARKL
ncbi:class I SAM-dependent methyltransferase [Dyadobacter sp. LJ53]|uniref:class I SAM-dependent methyltransferase n=1 Tax=Dyadobacter chenwenxiniae TaxID=2906456 RepID=UPI001F3F4FA9|nr:class I SAM-dependent methyltransferase [Dyadobacter chenwenxiniae]MCF0050368.1 class I SAM-dependent methyltransferase [Dyadobacter chenwenxiniae]